MQVLACFVFQEYERRHFIGMVKERDEAIQTLKSNTFKKNLEILSAERTGWFFWSHLHITNTIIANVRGIGSALTAFFTFLYKKKSTITIKQLIKSIFFPK